MIKHWFWGCPHLGHKNILKLDNRPFSDIDQHDDFLIDEYNKLVDTNDMVYIMGDIAWKQSYENYKSIFNRLKGRKQVLVGNHDGKQALIRCQKDGLIENVWDKKIIQIENDTIVLQHMPLREWDMFYHGSYHLYSHTHGNIPDYCKSTDTSIKCWEWQPVEWTEIKQYIDENCTENIHPKDYIY